MNTKNPDTNHNQSPLPLITDLRRFAQFAVKRKELYQTVKDLRAYLSIHPVPYNDDFTLKQTNFLLNNYLSLDQKEFACSVSIIRFNLPNSLSPFLSKVRVELREFSNLIE